MLPVTRSALLFAAVLSASGSLSPAMADPNSGKAYSAVIAPSREIGRQSDFGAAGQPAASPAVLDAYRRAAAYRAFANHRSSNDACNRARFGASSVDFQGYDAGDISC